MKGYNPTKWFQKYILIKLNNSFSIPAAQGPRRTTTIIIIIIRSLYLVQLSLCGLTQICVHGAPKGLDQRVEIHYKVAVWLGFGRLSDL